LFVALDGWRNLRHAPLDCSAGRFYGHLLCTEKELQAEVSMRLQDQVAIVTGAGRNIGEDICKLYVQEGAKVAVVDLDEGRGAKVAAEINARNPGRAMAVVCDVSSASSVDAMVQNVLKQFGRIDILVNNAAWTDHKTIFDITEEEWDRTMNVCLRSVWYCTRAAAKAMIEQKRRGKIINVASTSGHWGRKEATAYTTAKAGVLNLTRSIAVQLAPEGIRVNSISPNRIGSPVGQQDVPENRLVKNLAGRRGVPLDIAKAAVFLASDESDFIYAVDLPVDGGALAIRD
jgi:NAD(P)-dependent dehydrogenase (short-subunit alcohol dehydrogenase family)